MVIDQWRGGVVCGSLAIALLLVPELSTAQPAGSPHRKAVIGGLHLFEADEKTLAWTARELKRHQVKELIGAHCTGIESVHRLRDLVELTRQTCMVGAVGTTYSLARGIEVGRIAK
jgi:7,8-dihydropterin-6-yl-methyl-4-(beta-D-ribofuranosyl)aminobenzene 5'-phosphate synthase